MLFKLIQTILLYSDIYSFFLSSLQTSLNLNALSKYKIFPLGANLALLLGALYKLYRSEDFWEYIPIGIANLEFTVRVVSFSSNNPDRL